MDKADTHQAGPSKRRWRRAMVATSVVGGMLLSTVSVLPWAVMNSSYRDGILNTRVERLGLTATSASGTGGWWTAFSFHDVRLTDDTGQVTCEIKSVRLSKSLLSILAGGHDLGTITVVQPAVRVMLDENGQLPPKLRAQDTDEQDDARWDVAFDIQNAALRLSVPWRPVPIVDVKDVDISGAVATTEDGRWLTTDLIEIFDHEPLSELHTEQNLALIAPVLSQSTSLSGEVSAQVEGIRMRLDDVDASPWPVRGSATLHAVHAELKQEWAVQVSQALGRATGRPGGSRLKIAEESAVLFEVNERGIYHQGLAFLLQDLVGNMHIESSGLVGLDESVDLSLGLQLPQLVPRGPLMAAFSKMVRNPLVLRVSGTISEPRLETPPGMSLTDQLAGNLAPETQGAPPPSVPAAVMDLIGSSAAPGNAQGVDGLAGGVLNIIRAAQEARRNAPPREPRRRKRRPRKDL